MLFRSEFTNWLLDTAHYMLSLPSPPQVMTTSYGDNEENIPDALSEYVSSTFCRWCLSDR